MQATHCPAVLCRHRWRSEACGTLNCQESRPYYVWSLSDYSRTGLLSGQNLLLSLSALNQAASSTSWADIILAEKVHLLPAIFVGGDYQQASAEPARLTHNVRDLRPVAAIAPGAWTSC